MNLPGVSMVAMTYNRPPHYLHLLQETVECFRRQTYEGPKELLIISDTPRQTLACTVPGVRIVNLPVRLASLGQKRNLGVELARYDLIAPQDDDDISLPDRLTQAVEQLGALDHWKPNQVWYHDGHELHWKHNVGIRHHASIYTRAAWKRVGGYPYVSGSEDAGMDAKLMQLRHEVKDFPVGLRPEEFQYVYRWACAPAHLSGVAGGPADDPHRPHYEAIGRRPVIPGSWSVEPRWERDYVAMVAERLAAGGTMQASPGPASGQLVAALERRGTTVG